ncbi:MAG: Uma2 family endonuclease [Gemmataceae bacterium]|nr:Uma2 family endonuclease [Gemmataceae bacterium]
MNALTQLPTPDAIVYPESDGEPMADNTLQFQYILTIVGGLQAQYRADPNVFVSGNQFWYPVEGDNTIRQAPDAYVAFGRPKGERGSYRQWEEGGVPLHVVFEILSPSNRRGEMHAKWKFYQRYGVEEYYVYDPDRGALLGWTREGDDLVAVLFMDGWVSPRLAVRFQLNGKELELYHPDGRKFATYVELAERAEQEHVRADQEHARAEQERAEKEIAQRQADQERAEKEAAQRQADQERAEKETAQRQADEERVRAARWLAKLKELGIDPES